MAKRLTRIGNNLGLMLDQGLLDRTGIDAETRGLDARRRDSDLTGP
jgi:hypothetical protein